MEIFHYHPASREYLGTGRADPDPMQEGGWLIPAHATPAVVPPPVTNFAWVFDMASGEWRSTPDYRDVPLYSTEDGSEFMLGEAYDGLGDLPDDVTVVARPTRAHVWRAGKWQLDEALAASQAQADSQAQRTRLLNAARAAMEPLQMAAEIGEATETEAAQLLAWKRYIVALNRVNLAAPVWPEVPAQ